MAHTLMNAQSEAIADDAGQAVPPRYWWLKRIIAVVVVFLLLVLGLRLWVGHHTGRVLQAEIDRIQAAGEPLFPEDFDTHPIPDEDNAALLLQQAAKAWKKAGSLTIAPPPNEELSQEYQDDVQHTIEANSEALALIRQARALPDTDWGVRIRSPVTNFIIPNLSDQRGLARLLAGTAEQYHRTHNDAEAIETLHDLVAQADALDQQPGLISHLVAIAITSLAAKSIETMACDLRVTGSPPAADASTHTATRQQIKALITALLDETSVTKGLVRSYYCERMFAVDFILQALKGKATILNSGRTGSAPMLDREVVFVFKPILQLNGFGILRYTSALIEAAREANWPAAEKKLPASPQTSPGLRGMTHWLSSILLPSLERSVVMHFRTVAQRRMAATALGIRLYELDHGRRPASLDELVPKYLPAVPIDPFAADGRSIGYQPQAEPPVLYSLNSDGIDEQGKCDIRPDGKRDYDSGDMPFYLDGEPATVDPSGASTTSPSEASPSEAKSDEQEDHVGAQQRDTQ